MSEPKGVTDAAAESPPAAEPAPASIDRRAALAAGTPRLDRKYVWLMVAFVAVLGLGGLLAEHLVSSIGLNPTAVKQNSEPKIPSTTLDPKAPSVSASLSSFMGITGEDGLPAFDFSLVNEHGRAVSLADERGKVVVLTFFDGRCNDICPIVAEELRAADHDLGPAASHVVFLTINSDPRATTPGSLRPVLRRTDLGAVANWSMLTGPLTSLDATWKHYGLAVTMVRKTGAVAHNELVYFVDPRGRLRLQATPFANESRTGVYRLSPADVSRFGRGIALYAARLVTTS